MAERWNINNSALRGGLGSGTNTGSNGSVGNGTGISLGQHGGSAGGDGVGSGTSGATTTFSAANGESGILRRTGHYHQHGGTPENLDDLLVFGYSCKIFRDDERARFIDQARHLIPWMGDNQLKIDRYDARGALHDLSPYEPPPGGYQDRLEGLTAAEQRAEQLCEEERYYSLYNNEVEEEMYQEEARKRELMLGNQVAFSYDAPRDGESTVATVEERTSTGADDQDDDPYVPPKGFEIPPDIPLPETMKEHAIIEKTAKFIASQDAQMEILLKTKQANNPLFEFLSQSGRLFRYYRHVLLAFRTNQYPLDTDPVVDEQNGKTEDEATAEQNEADDTQTRPKIVVPAIKYKPSVDCAYTQLISKITGAPIPKIVSEAESGASDPIGKESDPCPEGAKTTPSVEVKKVSTGLAGLVQYDSDSDDDGDDEEQEKPAKDSAGTETNPKPVPLAPFQGVVPAVAIQHVIDRTAIYVAKNGYSFEEALRVKNDARFVFLNQAHEYYPYYAYRVRQRMNAGEGAAATVAGLREVPSPPPAKVRTETENGTVVETTPSLGIKAVHSAAPKAQPVPMTNIQHQKLGAPVSFSLVRKQKEDGGATVKTVPGLGSDEEDEEQDKEKDTHLEVSNKPPNTDGGEVSVNSSDELKNGTKSPMGHAENVTDGADLLVDGADVLEAASEQVSPATQLVDREPTVSREKQAERKKRANLFVNLIKNVDRKPAEQAVESTENGMAAEKLHEQSVSSTPDLPVSDVEEGSIHSIRSTSTSPKAEKVSDTPVSSTHLVVTTVIEDDDDDDVVLVSETRPSHTSSVRSRSRSRTEPRPSDSERTGNGADHRGRRSKKKKSKSHHRSTRAKKKSKKKSRSRSRSPRSPRSERSCSRRRDRKRSRSRSSSSEVSSSRSSVAESKRSSRSKQPKRSKRATSRSRSGSRSRSRSRTHRSRSHSKAKKRTRKRNESPERRSRKDRSRSRTTRRNSDSDAENHPRRHERGEPRRRADGGAYEYDERYPPARARYWDC
uniref:SURP motif domain-containing protein n=1 Tax=Anopheles dirus TaxID=7168 RepID=A0A182N6D2_9DIPT